MNDQMSTPTDSDKTTNAIKESTKKLSENEELQKKWSQFKELKKQFDYESMMKEARNIHEFQLMSQELCDQKNAGLIDIVKQRCQLEDSNSGGQWFCITQGVVACVVDSSKLALDWYNDLPDDVSARSRIFSPAVAKSTQVQESSVSKDILMLKVHHLFEPCSDDTQKLKDLVESLQYINKQLYRKPDDSKVSKKDIVNILKQDKKLKSDTFAHREMEISNAISGETVPASGEDGRRVITKLLPMLRESVEETN